MQIPLSEQLRPTQLNEMFGQEHLLGPSGWINRIIQEGRPLSILLVGPPGCGKTTLAKIYAQAFQARFISLSAIFGGVAELKKIVQEIKDSPLFNQHTILFVDEIHRFNKAQQDAFLPFIENGTFTLIGATTENPSFALNNALISRMRILQLNLLDEEALFQILQRYEKKVSVLPLTPEAKRTLIHFAQGDGRHLLNMVEILQSLPKSKQLTSEELEQYVQRKAALYDKDRDEHYNLISALHKSVRGSDPDAALYWFCRMLEGGEDPQYIARRIIRMAIEDIGLAEPQALTIALQAWQAYHQLGSPEGELALAQAVVFLSLSPKSNAVYKAFEQAKEASKKTASLSPPKIILNAPTSLMKQWGYGKSYQYDHEMKEAFSGQNYFPDEMLREEFYQPVERGFEREMKKRLDYFKTLRAKKNPPAFKEEG